MDALPGSRLGAVAPLREAVTCSVPGCGKYARTRGWCSQHYERWRLAGDPGEVGDRRKPTPKRCAIEDCGRQARSRTQKYCELHYRRWRKTGDPLGLLITKRPDGRHPTGDGYIRLWKPGHPLAKKDGFVLEHRYVMYEAGIIDLAGRHVHHINGDRSDNRLENLEVKGASEHHRDHLRERGRVQNQYGEWPVGAERPHGDYIRYTRGCRCDLCRAANTQHHRDYVERLRDRQTLP